MSSLDAISLPDMAWTDETDYSPVEAEPEYNLDGSMVLQPFVKQAGRPITLAGGEDFRLDNMAKMDGPFRICRGPNKDNDF